jgi:phage-related holin
MNHILDSALSTLQNLVEAWPAKAVATLISLFVSEIFQLHLHLFLLFVLLEFIDCFTKWLALSYKLIMDNDANAEPSLWDCVKNIPNAHRAEYIQSEVMRKQFANKMLTYLILIIAAGTGDYIIRLTHKPDMLLSLVVTYISATELLSVLENLNDAGVSMAAALLTFIKGKISLGGDNHGTK